MLRKGLRLEWLEDRCTPALTIQYDYRFDSAGFFNDPARRAILEQAGRDLATRIDSTPLGIVPGGGNSWTALLHSPATGETVQVPNLVVPDGTIVVFLGGRDLVSAEAGSGGSGGYSVGGTSAWIQRVGTRGMPAVSIWGGSIAFDTGLQWYTGTDASGLTFGKNDLYTVATHELGHVLGFGTSTAFTRWISGQTFSGPTAMAVNGGVAPRLSADLAHFIDNTTSNGQPAAMGPYLLMNQRYGFSTLDYAVMADLGWTISPPVTSPPPVIPPVSPPPPTVDPGTSPLSQPKPNSFLLSGVPNGLVGAYQFESTAEQQESRNTIQTAIGGGSFDNNGRALVQVGTMNRPFADFYGVVRTAIADVNGDDVGDIIAVTGAGGPSRMRVVNGLNGTDLIAPIAVFGNEFTGGLFVAAADFDRDGQADVVVSPDRGGGGRVSIFSATKGRFGDFFGIEDVTFRGGARVAAGDINGDGTPDLIVGAGTGGGPRIALFDGASVTLSKPRKLVGDFFAFPGDPNNTLRNGVYVASGDLNGDGKADLIFGAGPGGGPRVFALDAAKVLTGTIAAAQFAPLANFFAFDANDRGGVPVTVKDVDGDGRADLLAGSGAQKQIATYSGLSARWTGGDPGNGHAYAPINLAAALDGIYVG